MSGVSRRLTPRPLPPAVALAVLLALMAAVLLGSVVVFFAKLCRKGPECAAGHGWSPLDDKEHLMTSPYVL